MGKQNIIKYKQKLLLTMNWKQACQRFKTEDKQNPTL